MSTKTIYPPGWKPADDLTARMWADVPQLAALQKALGTVKARLSKVGATAPEAPHMARQRLQAALVAGQALPDDLGRVLHEENLAAEHFGRERNTLVLLADDLQKDIANTRNVHADTAFTVLHDELHQIIGAVRDLEPALAGVTTAEDAIRAGTAQTAAWATLTGLVDAYRKVRSAQFTVTADASGDRGTVGALIARAGYFANVAEHSPHAEYIADGVDGPTAMPEYRNGPEHLRWIARDDVLAWVPNYADLTDASTSLNQARERADLDRAQRNGKAGPEAEARARRLRARDTAAVHTHRVAREQTSRHTY